MLCLPMLAKRRNGNAVRQNPWLLFAWIIRIRPPATKWNTFGAGDKFRWTQTRRRNFILIPWILFAWLETNLNAFFVDTCWFAQTTNILIPPHRTLEKEKKYHRKKFKVEKKNWICLKIELLFWIVELSFIWEFFPFSMGFFFIIYDLWLRFYHKSWLTRLEHRL